MDKTNFKQNVWAVVAVLFAVSTMLGTTASAQVKAVPHYGEIYGKNSNKLLGKEWFSKDKVRAERMSDDGKTRVFIYRIDSAKFWMLNAEQKTCMEIPLSQLGNYGILGIEVAGTSRTSEFLGKEMVEGYECNHNRVTIITMLANGTQDKGGYDEWIYPPYNMWIMRQDGPYDEAQVMRNIVAGPQPDHLFELPSDYKVVNLPIGGLMDMLTGSSGRSEAEIKEGADDAKSQLDQLNNIGNDPNKTNQQKAQDMMKMLEGLNKNK